MAIRTKQSISGFIASEPRRSTTSNDDTRMYVRVGIPRYRANDDGTFTELDPFFHDMVAYKNTAEKALARLEKGDSFIAEGYVHTYTATRDGETIEAEEFVAKKIGHDLARTSYAVDRSARVSRTAARETPSVEASESLEEADLAGASRGL